MDKEKRSTTLHMRIDKDDLDDFRRIAVEKYGRDPNDMLREMIKSFNEGRLRIKPTAGQIDLFSDIYLEEEDK